VYAAKKSITASARLLHPPFIVPDWQYHIKFSLVINPPPAMQSVVKILWLLDRLWSPSHTFGMDETRLFKLVRWLTLTS